MTEEEMVVLLDAIRKQGRAAIAAQAAAQSCLEAVRGLNGVGGTPAGDAGFDLLRALLPAVDSLHRVAEEARVVHDTPRGWFARWVASRRTRRVEHLVDAVRLLEAQLESALESAGVTVDREVGVPVDAERHRVVSVRREGARVGEVLEVVRAGYRLGGHVVRETEVVVAMEVRNG